MASKLGPHAILTTEEGLAWARRASVVKQLDRTDLLEAAPDDAVRILRVFIPDGEQRYISPDNYVNRAIGALHGYRHPKLYVELLNEIHGHLSWYLFWIQAATKRLHEAGLRACGPSWATGDWLPDDWLLFREHDWCGLDLLALHAYWGLPPNTGNPAAVLTLWNALRYREYWQTGDPPVVITECGRDWVRDGNPEINDGMVGGAWEDDAVAPEQYVNELTSYDAELQKDEYVVGATLFTCGPTGDWDAFGVDDLADRVGLGGTVSSWSRGNTGVPTARTSTVGEGFRRATDLIGPWREDELYHAAGTEHETSLAIGATGYAVWRRATNETIVVEDEGPIWVDRGNLGQGQLRRIR